MSKKYDKKLIGLEQKTFPRSKQWQLDADFIPALRLLAQSTWSSAPGARQALEFYAQFNNEFYGAKVKKGDARAFHSSDELRKDSYNRSASNRRDIYSLAQASGRLAMDPGGSDDDESSNSLIDESIDPNAIFDASTYTNIPEKKEKPKPLPCKVYTPEEIAELGRKIGLPASKKARFK